MADEAGNQLDKSFDGFERAAFRLVSTARNAGLVRAFFTERETAKAPETRNAQPLPLDAAGVIGGGTVGAGITVALMDADFAVTMIERDEAALVRGRSFVEKVYDGVVAKGRMEAAVMARWSGS